MKDPIPWGILQRSIGELSLKTNTQDMFGVVETPDLKPSLFELDRDIGQMYVTEYGNQIFNKHELDELSDLIFDDTNTGLHPLRTTRQLRSVAISMIDRKDSTLYRDTAERLTNALVDEASEFDNGLYFPYNFDFKLHGKRERMTAPWYSGMAQGEILETFSLLYKLTQRELYRQLAERTFNSFLNSKQSHGNEHWFTLVDSEGYYWIEEFPVDPPPHTLNGKIFGIYGLYEWWRASGDKKAKKMTQKAIRTVYDHLPLYRRPNSVSYYCLGHQVTSPTYHQVHINQLEMLSRITESQEFKLWADVLSSDFSGKGPVRRAFQAGGIFYRFWRKYNDKSTK